MVWFIPKSNRKIPYDKNEKIPNSLKEGGDNYNEDIGNLNNGNDYISIAANNYDLYIPFSFLLKKIRIMELYYLFMVGFGAVVKKVI